jgi:hypothetical protein
MPTCARLVAITRFFAFACLLWIPSQASAQSIIFTDNFNRMTGVGANWQVPYGSFTTTGTSAVSGTPPISGNWARYISTPTSSDYAVSADIVITANSLYSGVVARSSGGAFDSDVYTAQLLSDGTLRLYRRNNWAWTLLQSVSAGIAVGLSYNVRLVTVGANPVHLEVWLNGVQQIAYDDSAAGQLTTGSAGIQNYASGIQYRKFEVDSVLFDRFSRTSGLGANWTVAYGSFTTDGAHAVSGTPAPEGNWAAITPAVATDDYVVSATIVLPSNAVNSGLVARDNSPRGFGSNLYALQLSSTDGTVNLYRRTSGNWNLLASANAGLLSGPAYAVRFLVRGSSPVHLEGWLLTTIRPSASRWETAVSRTSAPECSTQTSKCRRRLFTSSAMRSTVRPPWVQAGAWTMAAIQ